MRYFLTLVVVLGLMCWIELPGLRKKEMRRELVVFIVLSTVGTVVTLAKISGFDFAVLTDFLIKVFSPE